MNPRGGPDERDTGRGGAVFSVVIENLASSLPALRVPERTLCEGGQAVVWHLQGWCGEEAGVGSDGALAQNPQAPVLPTDTFLVLKYCTPPIQWLCR